MGIFDFQPQEGGLFGMAHGAGEALTPFFQNNQQAMLAAGSALLGGGGWQGAARGFAAGGLVDAQNRRTATADRLAQDRFAMEQERLKMAQAEHQQRTTAAERALAQTNKTTAWLTSQDPSLAGLPAPAALEIYKERNKSTKPSAFAEKVGLIRQANPNMSQADAIKEAMKPSMVVNTGEDFNLRKQLSKGEGDVWASYLEAGPQSSANLQNFEIMEQLLEMAPQGGITGRLAEFYPAGTSAGAALDSLVKQMAPTFRVEGSGSTSDVEFEAMLSALPRLRNQPGANRLILEAMRNKAQVNIERANVIRSFQNGELNEAEARNKLTDIEGRSILTPGIRSLIANVGEEDGFNPDDALRRADEVLGQ